MALAAHAPGIVELPVGPVKFGHIFKATLGHVKPSTLSSQMRFLRLFQKVASNPDNLVQSLKMAADAGVQTFRQTFRSGRQVWVQVRNGRIFEGGVNRAGSVR